MIALDTNVLARFITCDDEMQAKMAKKLILSYQAQQQSIFINDIVLCELCWLLKSGYQYTKQQIITVLQLLLNTEEFIFSDNELILEATLLYQHKSGDFSDYLIYVSNKSLQCECTYSFDQKMVTSNIFKKMI